jgi:Mce-associated membrane protein
MSRWGITRSAVVVAVLMGTATGVSGAAQEEDLGPGNRALIDAAATTAAIDTATSLSEELFSYTHTDPKAHEAKFGRLTTGAFSSRYSELFGDVSTQAKAQQLTLTSTVVEAAVQVLNEDSAGVLVFLDQESSSAVTGKKVEATAMFRATIHRVDGDWKFADIDLYEGK